MAYRVTVHPHKDGDMRKTTLEVRPIAGNPYGTHQGWTVIYG